ncbi:uncharacterized protein N7482_009905 [Penicillium canariense]|uniref:Uncharacterized protein n=1 Tax=Penicillium canariense TaxID=189055 RepID=A0A9W9LGH4_9EURO|nr:uncharacterized protein N7482_009905 [Penicillium canariense]KAJ5153427.1 hypothetical protein N7482_009905 [Penicillium canariense]
MSDSYSSSSYYYSSTSNGGDGTTTTGHRYLTTSVTKPDGTTVVRTARQDLGQPTVVEEHRYDSTGEEQLALPGPGGSSAGGVRRITDLDDETSGSSTLEAGSVYGSVASPHLEDMAVPFGTRVVDVDTGAYDEHTDYDTGPTTRHHREVRDAAGRKFHRDVEVDSSGLSSVAHEHRQYDNPETGTQLQADADVDVSEVI